MNLNIQQFEKIRESEGDYYEFFSYNMKCYIKRHDTLSLCGYVEIPKIHGFYKKYLLDNEIIYSLHVHGGITWENINDKGNLIIGFDCNHHNDVNPSLLYLPISFDIFDYQKYRNKEYVIEQIEKLTEQIHNIAPLYYDLLIVALKKMNGIL